jgi:hypothetical protein
VRWGWGGSRGPWRADGGTGCLRGSGRVGWHEGCFKLTNSGKAFEWGVSLAGTARAFPLVPASMFGGRVTVRLATYHEIFFEVAQVTLPCANTKVGYLGGYQYVFRAESMFRPYLGAALGYFKPSTNNSCPNYPQTSAIAGVLVAGLRFEPIPMIGIFAEGVGGAGLFTPLGGGNGTYGLVAALGGGLQIALPF